MVSKSAKLIREAWAKILLTDAKEKVPVQLNVSFVSQTLDPAKLFLKGVAQGLQLVAEDQEVKEKTAAYSS